MHSKIDWQKWFGICTTTDEIKREYKRLARQHHPDLGGDTRTMQEINAAFDAACREFVPREKPGKSESYYDWRASVDEALRQIIEQVIHLSGIEIEICGAWIWATGDTRTHKETFKAHGFKWSRPKTAWYWAGCASSGRGDWSLDDIRSAYGSQRIQREDEANSNYKPSTAPMMAA